MGIFRESGSLVGIHLLPMTCDGMRPPSPPDPPLRWRLLARLSCVMPIFPQLSGILGRSLMLRRCAGLKTCMDETELGQVSHALP